MRAIEVIEGRDRQRDSVAHGVQPGEIDEIVALVFHVVKDVSSSWIDRNLIMIAARGGNQAKLVVSILIKNERSEAADPGSLVVDDFLHRSFKAEVGAVAGKASVICEAFGVIANADLVVSGVEAAVAGYDLGLTVTFEARSRDYVEDAVSAITVLGGGTAALDFQSVNDFGIELRTNVRGDAGVGHGHAVEQPGNLMSTAYVKLVVDNVRTGDVVGDHGEAVAVGCV